MSYLSGRQSPIGKEVKLIEMFRLQPWTSNREFKINGVPVKYFGDDSYETTIIVGDKVFRSQSIRNAAMILEAIMNGFHPDYDCVAPYRVEQLLKKYAAEHLLIPLLPQSDD